MAAPAASTSTSTSTSTTARLKLDVLVEPTTPADLPSLAECELLAFSGAPLPSSSLAQRESDSDGAQAQETPFLALKNPFRAPLVRAGVHPRHWPDFASTVRKRAADMRRGGVFFTAFVSDPRDGGDGGVRLGGGGGGGGEEKKARTAVGYVKLMPPRALLREQRARRRLGERVMGDVVRPAVERLRERLWREEADGQDARAVAAFKAAQREVERRHPEVEECFVLHIMVVHPAYQRRGVGTALLARAIAHASGAQRALFIRDASPAGFPLYAAHGFRQVDAVAFAYRGVRVELPSLVREYRGEASEPRARGDEKEETPTEAGVGREDGDDAGTGPEEKALMSPKSDDEAVLVSPGMEARSDGSEDFVNVHASP